jgi:hypothetical protein
MKHQVATTAILASLLAVSIPCVAQTPFADVPKGHWAYDCVRSLYPKALLLPYPDGTFGSKRLMTRYEFTVCVARSVPMWEQRIEGKPGNRAPLAFPVPDRDDFACLTALADEFTPELKVLQVNVPKLKATLRRLRFAAMPAALRENPLAVPPPFADVPRNHWAYDAVCFLADRGIIGGYPD